MFFKSSFIKQIRITIMVAASVIQSLYWLDMLDLEQVALKKYKLASELQQDANANTIALDNANNAVIEAYTDFVRLHYSGIVDAIDMYSDPNIIPTNFDIDHVIEAHKEDIVAFYHLQDLQTKEAEEAFEKTTAVAYASTIGLPSDVATAIVKQAEIEVGLEIFTRYT